MVSRIMREVRQGKANGMVHKANGMWVQKAFSHNHGALHRELGVPQGEKIPERKLEAAEHSGNEKLRKRAQLAENARHFNHR